MTDTVLVTGGAGYVGSHAVLALLERGHDVVVLDDLSTGRADAVPVGVPLEVGSITDRALLADLLAGHRIGAVLHCAAATEVAGSLLDPLRHYAVNTDGTRSLTEACLAAGIGRVVLSSTAAVYGDATGAPVGEDAALDPISPYGRSKLAAEWVLRDASRAHPLRHVVLRYFNVAGADPGGRAGPSPTGDRQLIQAAVAVLLGRRPHLEIFGTDYPTPDGTCIRDFIHVSDLARVHVAALRHLASGGESVTLNCGHGTGVSVREVAAAAEAVAGRPLPVVERPRRAGDAARVVADTRRARDVLGWVAERTELAAMIGDALAFQGRGAGSPGERRPA